MIVKSEFPITDSVLFEFFYKQYNMQYPDKSFNVPIFGLRKDDRENGESVKISNECEKILLELIEADLFLKKNLNFKELDDVLTNASRIIKDRKDPKKNSEEIDLLNLTVLEIFAVLWEISHQESDKNIQFSSLKHKLKIKLLEAIWPRFIRRAVQSLRDDDDRDKGDYKSDLGINSLTEYFREYSKFEELLFGADDYQREHILHVFRVFLLGIYLIHVKTLKEIPAYKIGESVINFFDSLKINEYEQLTEQEEPNKRVKEKFAIWTLIALTHDLGYPLQKLDKINQRVSGMIKYFGISNFLGLRFNLPLQGQFLNEYILKFISSKIKPIPIVDKDDKQTSKKKFEYFSQIQSKYYTKFSNSFESLSHGVISCILLMKNLTYFLESDYAFIDSKAGLERKEAIQFLIRREILRAIASHDCDDIYQIDSETLSFLLIACDELQEWDRPFAKELGTAQVPSKVFVEKFSKTEIEFQVELNYQKSDFLEFVKRKVKRFIRLFRSGVDSELRSFSFKMWLIKGKKEDLPSGKPGGLSKIKELDTAKAFILSFPIPGKKQYYPRPEFIVITKGNEIKNAPLEEFLELEKD